MNDEQLTLAVARALGLDAELVKPYIGDYQVCVIKGDPDREFDPLTDPQWAAQMMCWLVERKAYLTLYSEWVSVEDGNSKQIVFADFDDHPTKSAAILRCLCEAVAKVYNEENQDGRP